MRLPAEVLRLVLEDLPLCSLASFSAGCREARGWCQRGLRRSWCCRSCGSPILHPRDVRHRLSLLSGSHAGGLVAAIPPGSRLARGEELQDDELWDVLQQGTGLRCAGDEAPGFAPLACSGCGKYVGDEFELEPGKSLAFFHAGFLALHDGNGRIPRRAGLCRSGLAPPAPLFCSGARGRPGTKGCGQPIASMDEVLSTQHCWRPIGGSVEQAWFLNAASSALQAGPVQPAQLAQGPMSVADLFCPGCGANVGWKFVADEEGENRAQVGRFGLVLSSLRTAATTRRWQQDPLVAALERCTSWAALEMQEECLPGRLAPDSFTTSTCSSDVASDASSQEEEERRSEVGEADGSGGGAPGALQPRQPLARRVAARCRLQASLLLRSVLSALSRLLLRPVPRIDWQRGSTPRRGATAN